LERKNNNMIKNYNYISSDDYNERIYISEGQLMSGFTIGILVQDVHYPIVPGNVVNADTYSYPVRMEIVPGANQKRMHSGDETLLPAIIDTCKKLEQQGCRAICGSCGYFGNFQRQVAEEIDVPVYLSSVIQVPWIRVSLSRNGEIGILCADIENFSTKLYESCGVTEDDQKRCHVVGAGHFPEFSALLERRGHFDNGILKQELVQLSIDLVNQYPKIEAILLECSDMPPYAAAIQRAVQLPVYDFITMIDYAHSAVAKKPYFGFM